jgi:hypothetical protein
MKHLSRREREGPAPQAWEGEELRSFRPILNHRTPSSSQASPGPLLLPLGEGHEIGRSK